MKIGFISDTHGYIDAWQKALEIFSDRSIELVIHTGDVLSSGPFNPRLEGYQPNELAKAINSAPFPIVFARGNCDADIDTLALDYPIEAPYALVYLNGFSIIATHGHLYDDKQLIEMGKRYKINLISRGHTHLRGITEYDNLVILNPGSAALPKNEDNINSIAVLENNKLQLIALKSKEILQEVKLSFSR